MDLICIDPRTDSRWARLVEQQESSVFHAPAWMQALTETYGLDFQAIVLIDHAGEPKAGLPICRVSDLLGERIVSLPFSDHCDPLVGEDAAWSQFADILLSDGQPVALRCLHNRVPLGDERFALVKQAKWHGLDLEADLDTIWRRFHDSTRWAIKKAQRDGVTARIAPEKEALRAFFEMHLGVRKHKHRLLAQPYQLFENLWSHFILPGNGALIVAEYAGEIIGGALFLRWKDQLYYKFNASVPAFLARQPNDLIMWEAIKHGKSEGCRQIDFGLSEADHEGLLRYKRHFGPEEGTISFLQNCSPEQVNPAGRRIRSLLHEVTSLLTDPTVPDAVTEKAGEALYRYFI